ncbi:MAG: DUF1830 domain-containing protein [Synechococcales bacterium]|nr:DUF1830 domain-containing protein [Synechococcales bacterium]
MAQIIDPVPANCLESIACCYINATSKIQVARITNIPNWYFERVVFPGQRLIFEAPPHAQLEIHCGMMASAILSDTIACDRLRIDEDKEPTPPTQPHLSEQEIERRNEGIAPTDASSRSHREPSMKFELAVG